MLRELIMQGLFMLRSKKRPQDFTRSRKMTFDGLVYFVLGTVKCSTQNALSRVFKPLQRGQKTMSQQAFSKARKKIKWEAFLELFRTSVEGSYNEELKHWRGFRLWAIDGTFVRLPSDAALLKHFGGLGPDKTAPTALASLLYDLVNDIVADATIVPIGENERDQAKKHIEVLKSLPDYNKGHRELGILDRGYPSHDFIRSLPKEMAYVMRVQKGFISPNKIPEGAKDCVVTLGEGENKFQVRVLHILLSSGEEEILITNLTEEEMEYEVFKKLYNMRWGIETKYQQLKQRLEMENFSGKLVDNVKQDFYAMMTVTNMFASCVRQAQQNRDAKPKQQRKGKENKYEYKINVNHAIGVLKDRFIYALSLDADICADEIETIINLLAKRVCPVKPYRSFPRKTPRKAKFHSNFRSNA